MPKLDFVEDVDIEKELAAAEEVKEETTEETETEETTEEQVETKEASEETTEETTEEADDKKQRKVDHGALHAERERRKHLQKQVEEYEAKQKTLEERLNAISEQMKKASEAPTPTYEDDPEAYLRAQVEKTGQTVEELRSQMEQSGKQQEAIQSRHELANRIVSSENAFRAENPDYDDAVNFLRQGRVREYQAMGYDDPSQIEQFITNEVFNLAELATRQGMTPAQLAYQVAQARGYAKAEKVENEDKKLEKVQKGQDRSKSLSGAGGESESVLDAEVLANMTDAEFAQAMKEGKWSKVMGSS